MIWGTLSQIPFLQQFVDPRSGRIKLKGSEFELIASLNEREEFRRILAFD
jgi:hypothetical protein